jgi:hypothetical protein
MCADPEPGGPDANFQNPFWFTFKLQQTNRDAENQTDRNVMLGAGIEFEYVGLGMTPH